MRRHRAPLKCQFEHRASCRDRAAPREVSRRTHRRRRQLDPDRPARRQHAHLPAGVEVVAFHRGPYCVFADDPVRLLRRRGRPARRLEDGFPERQRADLSLSTRLRSTSVSGTLRFVVTDGVANAWDTLGDPTRRAIVERLAVSPCAVGELASELPVSRPAVSQHLKVLKDAGLVSEEPAGTRRIYRLNSAGVSALRDQLDTFWNRALTGFGATLDTTHEETTP